jgi:hypothetical protein
LFNSFICARSIRKIAETAELQETIAQRSRGQWFCKRQAVMEDKPGDLYVQDGIWYFQPHDEGETLTPCFTAEDQADMLLNYIHPEEGVKPTQYETCECGEPDCPGALLVVEGRAGWTRFPLSEDTRRVVEGAIASFFADAEGNADISEDTRRKMEQFVSRFQNSHDEEWDEDDEDGWDDATLEVLQEMTSHLDSIDDRLIAVVHALQGLERTANVWLSQQAREKRKETRSTSETVLTTLFGLMIGSMAIAAALTAMDILDAWGVLNFTG